MVIKDGLKFKEGSLSLKVYDLYFKEGKTEEEICQLLKEDKEKVHGRVLVLQRKKHREEMKHPKQVSGKTSVIDMTKFIPKHNGYIVRYIGGISDVKILEDAYKNNEFVLLVGETGTGKTHLIRHFCFKNKLPYARVNLNGGTTADELIGHWIPSEDGGFRWQDGLLTTFARNGGVIAIDEVNACPADILMCLNSLTDDERQITLTSKDNEVIHAHPNFFLVCTMNPPEYEGRKPLDAAFKSRFRVKLFFDYSKKVERRLVVDADILRLAEKLRVMRRKGELSTPISTRDLIYYKKNKELFSERLAFDMFLNGFEQYEREPIRNVFEMLNGKPKEAVIEEEEEDDN